LVAVVLDAVLGGVDVAVLAALVVLAVVAQGPGL
jgi:hypothetical protein